MKPRRQQKTITVRRSLSGSNRVTIGFEYGELPPNRSKRLWAAIGALLKEILTPEDAQELLEKFQKLDSPYYPTLKMKPAPKPQG